MIELLIIDDDPIKIDKIKLSISSYKIKIKIANNIAEAVILLKNKLDLLILDLNIPLRKNELPKKDGGYRLINELKRNFTLVKPTFILGLTGYTDLKDSHQKNFDIEGWTLIQMDEENAWEEAVINKVDYLVKFKNQNILMKQKILFLSASPKDENRLRVDEEAKKIENEFNKASLRDNFEFISKFATDFNSASYYLLNNNPDYLHFSGHGNSEGIAVEDDNGESVIINGDTLRRLCELQKDNLKCILLNSCHSASLLKNLSEICNYAIGMNKSISDNTSIAFSTGFYQAIGAGKDILYSFKLGLAHIAALNTTETNIPTLWSKGAKINV